MFRILKDILDDRPLLAIDLDDVLFDCDSALKEILKREFRFNATYSELIEENSHTQENVFQFLYGNYHQNYSVVNGVHEAVSCLVTAYKMVVITGRSETTRRQTERWLKSNFAVMSPEVFFTNNFLSKPDEERRKKVEICANLGVSILIEDSWKEAVSVASRIAS